MNNTIIDAENPDCLVTIVTVSKDDAAGLKQTVASVCAQSFKNYELIVIEGGTNQGELAYLENLNQDLVRVVVESDIGIYHAMNKGMELANGQWLIYMNSGDIFAAIDSLENATKLINKNTDVIFSDWFYSDGPTIVKTDLNKMNVRHQAVIYRKSLHKLYGNYLVGKGVTISDYLFFLSISALSWQYCPFPIAVCDRSGASANPRHFYQRIASELIFGKRSIISSCFIFILYPIYRFLKRTLLRVR